jgi:hypothetical protein
MGRDPDASWHVCTRTDVACALRQFARLGETPRRELGARAHATIARDFSVATVARLIHSRILQQQ